MPRRATCLRPRGSSGSTTRRDRKSTRLNSSHSQISYAVFCLKKKTRGDYISDRRCREAVGRRGIKEYREPEALALIAADRERTLLVRPSCVTRSIQRVPLRRSHGGAPLVSERVTLTCQTCGRHASYIERGGVEAPRDSTMDPHPLASKEP